MGVINEHPRCKWERGIKSLDEYLEVSFVLASSPQLFNMILKQYGVEGK